jgi:hypothetical protein
MEGERERWREGEREEGRERGREGGLDEVRRHRHLVEVPVHPLQQRKRLAAAGAGGGGQGGGVEAAEEDRDEGEALEEGRGCAGARQPWGHEVVEEELRGVAAADPVEAEQEVPPHR